MLKHVSIIFLFCFLAGISLIMIGCSAKTQPPQLVSSTPPPEPSNTRVEGSGEESLLPTPSIQTANTDVPNITSTPNSDLWPTATAYPSQTPTELVNLTTNMIFRLAYGQYFDVFNVNKVQESFNHEVIQFYSQEPKELQLGPADALIATFANYSNKIAYWTGKSNNGKLYIYDLLSRHEQLIFTDLAGEYSIEQFGSQDISLLWSPDDLHLILRDNRRLNSSMIYNVSDNTFVSWPWDCDRIAVSPKTNRLATWCISLGSEEKFAVIEWEGHIWVSDLAPENEIVKRTTFQKIWSFSANGDFVAYFDPTDNDGNLFLANSQGNTEILLPDAAWWKNGDVATSKISIPADPIQWSIDGRKLLVFANESKSTSCPRWEDISASVSTTYNIPCWHLINLDSGLVDWSLGDSFQEEQSLYGQFDTAALSSKGEYVTITAESPGFFTTYLVNIDTREVLLWDSGASILRWEN